MCHCHCSWWEWDDWITLLAHVPPTKGGFFTESAGVNFDTVLCLRSRPALFWFQGVLLDLHSFETHLSYGLQEFAFQVIFANWFILPVCHDVLRNTVISDIGRPWDLACKLIDVPICWGHCIWCSEWGWFLLVNHSGISYYYKFDVALLTHIFYDTGIMFGLDI